MKDEVVKEGEEVAEVVEEEDNSQTLEEFLANQAKVQLSKVVLKTEIDQKELAKL